MYSFLPRNFNALFSDNPFFVFGILITLTPLFFKILIFLSDENFEVKIIVSFFSAVLIILELIGTLRFVSITILEGEKFVSPGNLQVNDGLSFKIVFIPTIMPSLNNLNL